MTTLHYGVVSDTHGRLHPRLFELFAGVEAIYHAGDLEIEDHLDELGAVAPVFAVCGNCDSPSPRLPNMIRHQLPFGTLLMTHGHLVQGYLDDPKHLVAHFAANAPRVIIHGHTHKARMIQVGGCLVLNPGAAGRPRFRDAPSVALLHWDVEAERLDAEHVTLDWSAPR